MKKFLLLSLFLASLTDSATEDSKKRFLHFYYSGKYTDAHQLLLKVNPQSRTIWEERLHIHEQFPDCHFKSDSASRAMALLQVGFIDQAKNYFGQDWLSFAGRAKLAGWNNDLATARNFLNKAIQLRPDHSDLLYYAGLYAASDAEAASFFERYLKTRPFDPVKKNVARQTIEFFQKSKGIDLNQSKLSSSVETIDSSFYQKKLTIRAKIDASNEVNLLVDTGAAGLSLKDKNWKARNMTDLTLIGLGAKQRTRAALVVFDEFQAGKFRMKNPVAAVSPALNGSGTDGILGAVLFSNYNMVLPMNNDEDILLSTLDSNQLLDHLQQNGKQYKQKVTLPFYQVGKMIIIKGKIKKSDDEMDILVDTGAQASILSAAAARRYVYINYPKTFREKRKSLFRGIGGKIDNLIHVENVDIEIGSLRKSFNRMVALNVSHISEALELEIDLILGQDFLNGYTLLIDYKKNLVTFLS